MPRSSSRSVLRSSANTRSSGSCSGVTPAAASQTIAAAVSPSRSARRRRNTSTSCACVTVYSDLPGCSSRSQTLNGSRRPPQRDVVLRTPLTTASTRPSSRVNRRTMRSASPSGRELSTTARAFCAPGIRHTPRGGGMKRQGPSMRRHTVPPPRRCADTTRGMPARSSRTRGSPNAPAAAMMPATASAWPAPTSRASIPPGRSSNAAPRHEAAVHVQPVHAAVQGAAAARSRARWARAPRTRPPGCTAGC